MGQVDGENDAGIAGSRHGKVGSLELEEKGDRCQQVARPLGANAGSIRYPYGRIDWHF
jgi:hypothetical protein